MQELVRQIIFGENKKEAEEKIKKIARGRGIFLTSTQKFYEKIARGDYKGFTVPAFNIRTLVFDVARALFRAVKKQRVGPFIVELAQSEMDYTSQSPEEYVSCVLAAALEEKFQGPLFLQGDHFHLRENKLRHWSSSELKNVVKKVIKAGFYNIDIDCSNLAPEDNFSQTAYFTNFIRQIEPQNLTISIGGEVGEIGGKNTTLEELDSFIHGYQEALSKYGCLKGIIKVAVQTGTSHGHGGVIDFTTLRELAGKAKEYGLAGIVQHGASMLTEDQLKEFSRLGICEIHLATIFQNIIYESFYFPEELKEKIYSWLKNKFSKEKRATETEMQFLYKFRKRALGTFKEEIWSLPQKNIDKICEELEEKFTFFLKVLNVSGTKDLISETY